MRTADRPDGPAGAHAVSIVLLFLWLKLRTKIRHCGCALPFPSPAIRPPCLAARRATGTCCRRPLGSCCRASMACSPTACCSCWRWVGRAVLVQMWPTGCTCTAACCATRVSIYPFGAVSRLRCNHPSPAWHRKPPKWLEPPLPALGLTVLPCIGAAQLLPTHCLQVSFPYIGIADLRAIPLAVLDRLQVRGSVARQWLKRGEQRFGRSERQAGGTQLPKGRASCATSAACRTQKLFVQISDCARLALLACSLRSRCPPPFSSSWPRTGSCFGTFPWACSARCGCGCCAGLQTPWSSVDCNCCVAGVVLCGAVTFVSKEHSSSRTVALRDPPQKLLLPAACCPAAREAHAAACNLHAGVGTRQEAAAACCTSCPPAVDACLCYINIFLCAGVGARQEAAAGARAAAGGALHVRCVWCCCCAVRWPA